MSVAPTTASIITTGLVLNLDAGNVASYPGTGTTWTDLSGNGNNATLINGTSYSSSNGGALVFDGINDYVQGPNLLYGLSKATLCGWVKKTSTTSVMSFGVMDSLGGKRIEIVWYLNGNLYGECGGNDNFWVNSLPPKIDTGWHFICFTYDGSQSTNYGKVSLYFDGALLTNSDQYNTIDSSITVTGPLVIGNRVTGYSTGMISNIQIYNKVLSASEILQNFNATKSRFGFTSYTSRTTAFAAATGITDTTILNALNTFDTGLISNGLDTKMKALYPFVGGTANTHKFNFMDARDVNAAFRLAFNGGGVHSLTGYKPNGTNAYADPFYNQTTQGDNVNSGHLSYYSRTNSNGAEVEMGASGVAYTLLEIRTSGVTYPFINQGAETTSFADADSLGFYVANRNASNVINCWKSGVKKVSGTNISTLASNYPIFIGALNTSFAQYYTTKECAFASIGSGLTDGEASAFYNLVQAMQTTLSRQV